MRRSCLLQNVSGSRGVEDTDAHNQLIYWLFIYLLFYYLLPGLLASDCHTRSSETTAHLGHLFSISISKQSSREAEQASWKLHLKGWFALRTFVTLLRFGFVSKPRHTPKQTAFEMLHDNQLTADRVKVEKIKLTGKRKWINLLSLFFLLFIATAALPVVSQAIFTPHSAQPCPFILPLLHRNIKGNPAPFMGFSRHNLNN